MLYTIGEAARKMSLTTYTLRYYDREGILPFVDRSASGLRMFKDEDLDCLKLIECLKAAGMPLKEIKQFVEWFMEGDTTLEQRRELFYDRKKKVEEQIASLHKTLDTLTYKCWFYDTAVESGSARVPKSMKLEELPPEIRELKEKIDL